MVNGKSVSCILCVILVTGPLSDILQLLLRAIFRLQESEDAEIAQDEKAAVGKLIVIIDSAVSTNSNYLISEEC